MRRTIGRLSQRAGVVWAGCGDQEERARAACRAGAPAVNGVH
jgi:hypothetical protein